MCNAVKAAVMYEIGLCAFFNVLFLDIPLNIVSAIPTVALYPVVLGVNIDDCETGLTCINLK